MKQPTCNWCQDAATEVIVWRTKVMAAPAFEYACERHSHEWLPSFGESLQSVRPLRGGAAA